MRTGQRDQVLTKPYTQMYRLCSVPVPRPFEPHQQILTWHYVVVVPNADCDFNPPPQSILLFILNVDLYLPPSVSHTFPIFLPLILLLICGPRSGTCVFTSIVCLYSSWPSAALHTLQCLYRRSTCNPINASILANEQTLVFDFPRFSISSYDKHLNLTLYLLLSGTGSIWNLLAIYRFSLSLPFARYCSAPAHQCIPPSPSPVIISSPSVLLFSVFSLPLPQHHLLHNNISSRGNPSSHEEIS